MAKPVTVKRVFKGKFSADDVRSWIDFALLENAGMKVQGIAMSKSVFELLDKPDRYNGAKVAMDADLYPDDVAELRFLP